MKLFTFSAAVFLATAQDPEFNPSLDGQSFKITIVQASGYVDVDPSADDGFSGYVIDMISSVAKRAKFEYTLQLPSGHGINCSPTLDPNSADGAYGSEYVAAYLCGQNDALGPVPVTYQTDMYWSMFYVTNQRQLAGKFSLPFKPPTHGLTMYGTATGINNFQDLIGQQETGKQGKACVGGNTAYANWLADAMPALQTIEILNTEAGVDEALASGKCTVVINAEHAAVHFVRYHYEREECEINGKPVGIIGDGLEYGLTQMAIGFNENVTETTVRAMSYWLNDIMTCSSNDPDCSESLYAAWIENFGRGDACGYIANPASEYTSRGAIIGTITGYTIASLAIIRLLASNA